MVCPTFYEFQATKTLFENYISKKQGWKLLGFGFNEQQTGKLLSEQKWPPTGGAQPTPLPNLADKVARKIPMPTGGQFIGFDVLTIDSGNIEHSFLCNSLDVVAQNQFGIKLNQFALLDTESDAQKLVDYCNSDEAKAEPEPWYFCKVIDFS